MVVTAATALLGLTKSQHRARANVRYDAETLKGLPEGSEAYGRLAAHIDDQVRMLAKVEREGTRAPILAFWCFSFALVSGYGGVVLYVLDHWWTVLIAMLIFILALLFLYMGFDNLVLAERNDKGNRVRAKALGAPSSSPLP